MSIDGTEAVDSPAVPAGVIRATLLVMFSACCFGSIATLVTVATNAGTRLIDVLAWRFLLAALLLVAVSGGLGTLRPFGRRGLPLLVFAGGGQALIGFIGLSALRYVTAATMIFLFYSYPAWVTLISAIQGKDPLTGRRLLALGLSLAGIALMVGVPGAGGVNVLGASLALLSGFLYALYIPMIGHFGEGLPPAVTSTFASAGAAVIFVAVAMAGGGLALRAAPVAWLAMALLAVVCTVIAFMAFLRGLAVIGPVRTAIVSTIEPFWGALLASVVLTQPLSPRTLGGGLLIAAAVIILNLPQRGVARVAAV
ncbi:MAG: DMT family transporter [Gemmatimonadaceae bacterium]